ncbi:MAG: glycosyltransferase, partial [Planctomycetaceae bacterium]|nr:glycosyltransferase [Planctomycetaceae bacterium]
FLKILSPDSVCADIIGTALDVSKQIDCVIFVDGLYFRGQRQRVPQSIRQAGVMTVLIATDDPYESLPNVESLYTYRFTNEIRSASATAVYLPTATLPLPELPRLENPEFDVSFLGTVFEDRRDFLLKVAEFCEQEQKRFLVAGKILGGTEDFKRFTFTTTRQRTIDTQEKWEIYAQSRVTINLFRKTDKPADSPSPRVFEVAAFGHAALLSGPSREEVQNIFGDAVYGFEDEDSAIAAIRKALASDSERIDRVERAREIVNQNHLYEHRARTLIEELRTNEQKRSPVSGLAEHKIAWIIGCGRTGSTWLAEMLGALPNMHRWHEPYFGRFLRHLQERPDDLHRNASFFSLKYQDVWLDSLRQSFFRMVHARYPKLGRHGLFVKEVNTPELFAWIQALFPTGRLILLTRDPYDTLDSYLDLQRPGSWNQRFGDQDEPLSATNVEPTAEHIRSSLSLALAAYDVFPVEQRLRISYEELLEEPGSALIECAQLISLEVAPNAVEAAVEKHAFKNYKQTGKGKFRRSGKAGVWKTSDNFTSEVRQIAQRILGPLRVRMGYEQESKSSPESDSTSNGME